MPSWIVFFIGFLAVLAIFGFAHWIDWRQAKSLHDAHRKERRRITIIREGQPEHVGEWVKP
jgi:hypothetical protein